MSMSTLGDVSGLGGGDGLAGAGAGGGDGEEDEASRRRFDTKSAAPTAPARSRRSSRRGLAAWTSGAKLLRASGSVRKSCAGAALPGTVGDGRTEGASCVRACGTLEGADATVPKSALMIAPMIFEIVTALGYH